MKKKRSPDLNDLMFTLLNVKCGQREVGSLVQLVLSNWSGGLKRTVLKSFKKVLDKQNPMLHNLVSLLLTQQRSQVSLV
ncbi:hypothetical protein JHL22_13755 [Advenella sp. WQ 585]|uniref:Uncharacterized protein n=1 Tax=Advenella mandrilli TaxID=2800330 RepID=A0ABS1EGY5_9BURK|nr:hypothetical protein [Advenella mandrilli]MBK1782278.1 hypothetical protein [Advenella mandrilli]